MSSQSVVMLQVWPMNPAVVISLLTAIPRNKPTQLAERGGWERQGFWWTLPGVAVITCLLYEPGTSGKKAPSSCPELHCLGSAGPKAPALSLLFAQR